MQGKTPNNTEKASQEKRAKVILSVKSDKSGAYTFKAVMVLAKDVPTIIAK